MSNDLMQLDLEQLALLAESQLENEATIGNGPQMLSTRNGRLSLGGQPIAGDLVQCVVLCAPFENLYYDATFNAAELVPPKCFAMNLQQAEMEPSPRALAPQSDACFSCKHNQWGSSTTGSRKGKACRNTRHITFLTSDEINSPASIMSAKSYALRPPVTSVAAFGDYTKKIAIALRKPLFAVVTEIKLVPDAKSQFRVEYRMIDEITDPEILIALMNRAKSETDALIARSNTAQEADSHDAQLGPADQSVEDKEVF